MNKVGYLSYSLSFFFIVRVAGRTPAPTASEDVEIASMRIVVYRSSARPCMPRRMSV